MMRQRLSLAVAASFAMIAVLVPKVPAQAQPPPPMDGWHLDAINAPEAHAVATGEGVVVAVLDSGVGLHPYLDGKVLEGASMVDSDPRSDGEGHGTNMAATIISVAPDARILPVQVSEWGEDFASQPVREGIRWAVDHGADVVNISISGDAVVRDDLEAIRYALDHDVVVVAGTGNEPDQPVGYPAAVPGVLAVSGIQESGEVYVNASTGPETALSAPADNMPGLIPDEPGQDIGYSQNNRGTSQSTAVVSGAVALVRAAHPDIDAGDVINRLLQTAQDAGAPGRDDEYGFGTLDAHAAVTADVEPVDGNPLGDPCSLVDEVGLGLPDAGSAVLDACGPRELGSSSGSSSNTVPVLTGVGGAVAVLVVVLLAVMLRNRRKPPASAMATSAPATWQQGPPPPPPSSSLSPPPPRR